MLTWQHVAVSDRFFFFHTLLTMLGISMVTPIVFAVSGWGLLGVIVNRLTRVTDSGVRLLFYVVTVVTVMFE